MNLTDTISHPRHKNHHKPWNRNLKEVLWDLKIMLVQYGDPSENTLCKRLSACCNDLECINSFSEAKKRFDNHYYEMIITDFIPHNKESVSLIEHIREKAPSKVLILLTETLHKTLFDVFLKWGAQGVITKPVAWDWLEASLYRTGKNLHEQKILYYYHKEIEHFAEKANKIQSLYHQALYQIYSRMTQEQKYKCNEFLQHIPLHFDLEKFDAQQETPECERTSGNASYPGYKMDKPVFFEEEIYQSLMLQKSFLADDLEHILEYEEEILNQIYSLYPNRNSNANKIATIGSWYIKIATRLSKYTPLNPIVSNLMQVGESLRSFSQAQCDNKNLYQILESYTRTIAEWCKVILEGEPEEFKLYTNSIQIDTDFLLSVVTDSQTFATNDIELF